MRAAGEENPRSGYEGSAPPIGQHPRVKWANEAKRADSGTALMSASKNGRTRSYSRSASLTGLSYSNVAPHAIGFST